MVEKVHADEFYSKKLQPGTKGSYWLTFDTSDAGEAYIPVHVVKGQLQGPTLLILAAVHGDEYEGVQTAIELCRDLLPQHIRGTAMFVPVTNVSAYYGISRNTPEDGGNLAREFPGTTDGTVTQRLAWYIAARLLADADFLLDFHSGGAYLALTPFVGYYHHDSELGRRSQAAAEAFGMTTIWGHERILPGRTITAATEQGIPWLYTEGYGGRRVKEEEQLSFRNGALRLMEHLSMLIDSQTWIREAAPPIRLRLRGSEHFDLDSTQAEMDGFFIPAVRLGDRVEPGDKVGAVYDWFGQEVQGVYAEIAGYVVSLSGTPKVQQGMNLYLLANE
jgi:predicted deacylase